MRSPTTNWVSYQGPKPCRKSPWNLNTNGGCRTDLGKLNHGVVWAALKWTFWLFVVYIIQSHDWTLVNPIIFIYSQEFPLSVWQDCLWLPPIPEPLSCKHLIIFVRFRFKVKVSWRCAKQNTSHSDVMLSPYLWFNIDHLLIVLFYLTNKKDKILTFIFLMWVIKIRYNTYTKTTIKKSSSDQVFNLMENLRIHCSKLM